MEHEPDSIIEDFSLGVFTYLRYKDGYATINAAGLASRPMPVLIPAVAKVVCVLSESSNFYKKCEEHFEKRDVNRRNVFTFISSFGYRCDVLDMDIFFATLKTLAFVHAATKFCEKRNYLELILRAPMCWSEIFVHFLADRFYVMGGWEEFQDYVINNRYFSQLKPANRESFLRLYKEVNSFFSMVGVFRRCGGVEQSGMQQQQHLRIETSGEETDRNQSGNLEQKTDSSSEDEIDMIERMNRLIADELQKKTNSRETADEETDRNQSGNLEQKTDSSSEDEIDMMETLNRFMADEVQKKMNSRETADEETDRNQSGNLEQKTDSSSADDIGFIIFLYQFYAQLLRKKLDSEESSELQKKIIPRSVNTRTKILRQSDEAESPQETGENPSDKLESDDGSDSVRDLIKATYEITRLEQTTEFVRKFHMYKKVIRKSLNTIRRNYNLPLSEYAKDL